MEGKGRQKKKEKRQKTREGKGRQKTEDKRKGREGKTKDKG